MWFKAKQYLKKMSNVILLASIIIWALGYFPRNVHYSTDYTERTHLVQNNANLSSVDKETQLTALKLQQQAEKQEKSYIGQLGHAIEPVISPLGYDWKMGVSIVTGLAAKEVVVSSMGVLYQADEASGTLKDQLIAQKHTSGPLIGQKVITPLVALSFMLFILIYFPCVAAVAAIKKEAGWKWAIFTILYTTSLAWVVAFLTYQIGSLFV
jgi:ferrous iron transport protein B